MQMIRIFCADLASVEEALEIIDNFGTQAIWLGKLESSIKGNPLQLKWLHTRLKS